MKVEEFIEVLGADYFVGVPDSQLRPLCDYLMHTYGIDNKHHIIAANEGNCVGIAAGYHLATGNVPVVYMQNSGEGNIINPVVSLTNENVYAIPMIFIIGWRGEPGVHDEPQHVFQGQITLELLEILGIEYFVIDKDTSITDLKGKMRGFKAYLEKGKQVAFVIKKNALEYEKEIEYKNNNELLREEIIERIVSVTGDDLIISTTGKASRELFEVRERLGEGHERDFLTVGSMGHSSSVALGLALNRPDTRIWCIDGDGAVLMHMGAMAVIGKSKPQNLVHIIINNGAHESVGGMPTVASKIDFSNIAKDCGYEYAIKVDSVVELEEVLKEVRSQKCLSYIEISAAIGARADLGRPTTTPKENKEKFMEFIN